MIVENTAGGGGARRPEYRRSKTWKKIINECYTKLGEPPLFATSIILHPVPGKSYLEMNWATDMEVSD